MRTAVAIGAVSIWIALFPFKAAASTCGDGFCDGTETCSTCPSDCYCCTGSPSPCRQYTAPNVTFAAGSLIIDQSFATCIGLRGFGLAWFLLQNGVHVAWTLNLGKTTSTSTDFTVTALKQVMHKTGATTTCVSPLDISSTVVSKNFGGMSFVIPAEDATLALQLIYDGTLPGDNSVAFGCSNFSANQDFTGVVVWQAQTSFTAPVLRLAAVAPGLTAMLTTNRTTAQANRLYSVLMNTGLTWGSSTDGSWLGTPNRHGFVVDQMSNLSLLGRHYPLFYTDGVGGAAIGGALSAAQQDVVQDFVIQGGAVLQLEYTTNALFDCPGGVCQGAVKARNNAPNSTQFISESGMLDAGGGNGPSFSPNCPQSPWTQVYDDNAYKTTSGVSRLKMIAPTGWAQCSWSAASPGNKTTDTSDILIAIRDQDGWGPVMEIMGNESDAQWPCKHGTGFARTSINMLFQGLTIGNNQSGEFTRSSPIVVERTIPTAGMVSFQGTSNMPPRVDNVVFDAAHPSTWVFPATVGHMRAYQMSSSTSFTELGSLASLWDGLSAIPSSDRKLYTTALVSSTNGLQRQDFNTTNVTASRLGWSSGDPSPVVSAIYRASLGGVDQATPAYITNDLTTSTNKITFNGYHRPVVLYVPALDGMLHAFKVPDVENETSSWTWSSTDWSAATELWAFVPDNQLDQLTTNMQSLEASPAVADIYGAILQDDGTPAAAQSSGNRTTKKNMVTVLALPSSKPDGSSALYLLDITNPDPSDTHCPTQWATTIGDNCVHGPNPLWIRSTANDTGSTKLGRATGASIGIVYQGGAYKPTVFVATDNYQGNGMRLFAFDAATGDELWPTSHFLNFIYHRKMAGKSTPPNAPPAAPVLIGGANYYQDKLYLADYEGKIWQVSNLGSDPPTITCLWDANASASGGGACTETCSGATCEATSDTVTVNYPISAPLSIYTLSGSTHLTFATGGAFWAPANASNTQYIADINITSGVPTSARLLQSFVEDISGTTCTTNAGCATGQLCVSGGCKEYFKAYAGPITVGQDIYLSVTAGQPDILSYWYRGGDGLLYRINTSVTSGTFTTTSNKLVSSPMAGYGGAAALGVTADQSQVVLTGTTQTGVVATGYTSSAIGSTNPNSGATASANSTSAIRMWLPALR